MPSPRNEYSVLLKGPDTSLIEFAFVKTTPRPAPAESPPVWLLW